MTSQPQWIAVSAISALGIGILATGAIGVANAMPLVDTTTTAEVPPISTVPADLDGGVDSGTITFPAPSSTPVPSDSPTVAPTDPPAPRPVAPQPAATADDSVVTPPAPGSVDDDSNGSGSSDD